VCCRRWSRSAPGGALSAPFTSIGPVPIEGEPNVRSAKFESTQLSSGVAAVSHRAATSGGGRLLPVRSRRPSAPSVTVVDLLAAVITRHATGRPRRARSVLSVADEALRYARLTTSAIMATRAMSTTIEMGCVTRQRREPEADVLMSYRPTVAVIAGAPSSADLQVCGLSLHYICQRTPPMAPTRRAYVRSRTRCGRARCWLSLRCSRASACR
jgi:hypothetical protein